MRQDLSFCSVRYKTAETRYLDEIRIAHYIVDSGLFLHSRVGYQTYSKNAGLKITVGQAELNILLIHFGALHTAREGEADVKRILVSTDFWDAR
jgi:hypothetical protein